MQWKYRIFVKLLSLKNTLSVSTLITIEIGVKWMNSILITYSLLACAIIAEVIGSTFLVKSEGFTKLWPSLAVLVLFSIAFYLLSQVVKVIPLGVTYAIWSGVGIVLTAIIGFLVFKQHLDVPAVVGMVLIIAGVIVINLFSKTTSHWEYKWEILVVENSEPIMYQGQLVGAMGVSGVKSFEDAEIAQVTIEKFLELIKH